VFQAAFFAQVFQAFAALAFFFEAAFGPGFIDKIANASADDDADGPFGSITESFLGFSFGFFSGFFDFIDGINA
jgi:hypothetical protein